MSEFNLRPDALKDGEKIKVIAAIIGPGKNKDLGYYNHLIAVSQESGDTCNVLIPYNPGFTEEDMGKEFNYFNPQNFISTIEVDKIQGDQENINIEDLTGKFPEYRKVYRSSKFDYIGVNNYPTVKGSVGTKG